eukprot:g7176.t1
MSLVVFLYCTTSLTGAQTASQQHELVNTGALEHAQTPLPEEPGFASVGQAEAAMADLLTLAEGERATISNALAQVHDKRGMSEDEIHDAQIQHLLPVLARLLKPLIKKYQLWRDSEPTPGANFLAFMHAFDRWGNPRNRADIQSEKVNAGLAAFHSMLIPPKTEL